MPCFVLCCRLTLCNAARSLRRLAACLTPWRTQRGGARRQGAADDDAAALEAARARCIVVVVVNVVCRLPLSSSLSKKEKKKEIDHPSGASTARVRVPQSLGGERRAP